MSARAAAAVALRVLSQLRRDPRTVALLVGVPSVLIVLLHELFAGREEVFQHVGGPLLGLFPFVSMFVVTSVTMLRERTTGTLERLMTMPLAKLDLLTGYGAAFAAMAAIQVSLVSVIAFVLLDLHSDGPVLAVVVLAIGNAVLGMALGLFASAFASTEFQAVQFMPAIVLPQMLLCGLFVARSEMADWLRVLSALLPLTYAYDALARAIADEFDRRFALDVCVVLGSTLLALLLGAVTLRRRTD
ncbi:MAG TPA: ABC transporter permease [Gaiellaceae bacterium]